MKLATVFEQASKFSIPTRAEEGKVNALVKKILQKVNSQLKKDKIAAELIIGGSVAKGTWLPGISDIDFFLQFNYREYNGRSAELDDITEGILKKCFKKFERLRGSRDYFSLEQDGFYIEIVPVLKIKSPAQAKNITDASPLHIYWVKEKIKKKPKLVDEMRLAKQFFKANELYGAESYIRGFSGHVIEVLVAHHGSFLKLIKAVSLWEKKEVIDIEKRYRSSAEALAAINPSKTEGPLIIVDPVEAGRNAAAALSAEKFNLAKEVCKKFLIKPNINFFKIKPVQIKDLIAKKKKRRLIILKAQPEKRKVDIAGAKLLKKFELLKKELSREGFKVLETGWWWDTKSPALFWFYLDPKALPKTKIHWGPPVSAPEKFIKDFKAQWKKHKVGKIKARYYVELKRKFTRPENFLKDLIKTQKGISFVKL